jgi:hypothetical protein
MRIFLESLLPCEADLAWSAVQTSALLLEIAAPLISLRPERGQEMPARWPLGVAVRLRPRLFGIVPLATRTLNFERIDHDKREIQTREFDALIRRWDHRIQVQPAGAETCRYTDDVEIQAGVLTPLAWLFAQWFYRHRQKRWRRVAERLAAEAPQRTL